LFCKSLSRPVLKHAFRPVDPATGEELQHDEPSQFVSAVCWMRGEDVLVAANSQGTIKACRLTEDDGSAAAAAGED
jgi:E3 ubiquitin-protein ligase RFWD2